MTSAVAGRARHRKYLCSSVRGFWLICDQIHVTDKARHNDSCESVIGILKDWINMSEMPQYPIIMGPILLVLSLLLAYIYTSKRPDLIDFQLGRRIGLESSNQEATANENQVNQKFQKKTDTDTTLSWILQRAPDNGYLCRRYSR